MKKLFILSAMAVCQLSAAWAQMPDYAPTSGVKSFKTFSGNALDMSGNANNALPVNADPTQDRFGNDASAYHFYGGGSSYMQEYFSSFTGGAFTISAWARSSTSVHAAPIVGEREAAGGLTDLNFDDGGVYFHVSAGSSSVTAYNNTLNFVDGNWHFFCGTFDGSTLNLYADNVLVATNTVAAFTPAMTAEWQIGVDAYDPVNRGFIGDIDEIGMWDRVLDGCEIDQLYLASVTFITSAPPDQTVTAATDVTFSVTNVNGNFTYQWQEDAGSGFNNISNNSIFAGTGTANLTLHNVPQSYNGHKYQCQVDYLNNCGQTSGSAILFVNPPTAVTNINAGKDIVIAPNPAQNTITVTSPIALAKVEIYDVVGRQVLATSAPGNTLSIDISSLASGAYFVKINGQYTIKVIKS